MVNEKGQLYTIEGIAASALILTTVFLVLNSTIVFTPAETHIYDMQLQQIGTDTLAVMDMNTTWNTSTSSYPKSPLEEYIENNRPEWFRDNFTFYANSTTGSGKDDIQFTANITYNNGGDVRSEFFAKTRDYNRENAVRVTKWVNVNGTEALAPSYLPDRNQTVLLEVLLWRG